MQKKGRKKKGKGSSPLESESFAAVHECTMNIGKNQEMLKTQLAPRILAEEIRSN